MAQSLHIENGIKSFKVAIPNADQSDFLLGLCNQLSDAAGLVSLSKAKFSKAVRNFKKTFVDGIASVRRDDGTLEEMLRVRYITSC
jgi:hypothetical protein